MIYTWALVIVIRGGNPTPAYIPMQNQEFCELAQKQIGVDRNFALAYTKCIELGRKNQ